MIPLSDYIKEKRWGDAEALLRSPTDASLRLEAGKELKALVDLRPDVDVGPLLPVFVDLIRNTENDHIVRESACRAITQAVKEGADASPALSVLRDAVREKNKTIKAAAAETLALYAVKTGSSTDIESLLKDASDVIRAGIMRAMGTPGRMDFAEQGRLVIRLMQSYGADPWRAGAPVALAVLRILDALPDADKKRRWAESILDAAGKPASGGQSAWNEMIEKCSRAAQSLMRPEDIPGVVANLRAGNSDEKMRALQKIGYSQSQHVPLPGVMECVLPLAKDPDDSIGGPAMNIYMDDLVTAGGWDKATALLRSPEPLVRERAVAAAGLIGLSSDVGPLVSTLVEYGRSNDGISAKARKALSSIALMGRTNVQEWLELRGTDLFKEDAAEQGRAAAELAAASVMGHSVPDNAMDRLREEQIIKAKRSAGFPDFSTPVRISDELSWTATYDSWDQYHDDAYYLLALYKNGVRFKRYFVKFPYTGLNDDEQIFGYLDGSAREGKPNTEYKGSVFDTTTGAFKDVE